MKAIKFEEAMRGKNSEKCKTLEYSFMDEAIDLGVAEITGRYPDHDYGVNLVSKELIYVMEGSGILNFEDKKMEFKKGDAVLIQPNEKYYYETAHCVLSMSCTPAWTPDQHKIVK